MDFQWQWDMFDKAFPLILKAVPVTIGVTLVGFVIAMALGLLLAMMRRSTAKPVKYASMGFVSFIRNTPLLVQIYFIFYALPNWGIILTPFAAGAIGLGLHYSTYLSEVYRSGIDSVPKGQWEASTALNFGKLQTWFKIILPQAIPPTIPVIGNYLIMMFKETPLLSTITLSEMMLTATSFGGHHFRYLEAISTVGIFFLIMSYPASLFVDWLERRMARLRA